MGDEGRYFHLLISSSISFFRELKFLSYRSFTSMVRITPWYFLLFVVIVKGIISLFSSGIYHLCNKRVLTLVDFEPSHSAEGVYQLQEISGRILGSLMYTIISSASRHIWPLQFQIPCIPLISFYLSLCWMDRERVGSLTLVLVRLLWISIHSL